MKQPQALRLADALRDGVSYDEAEIENELRRLHAQRDALLEALQAFLPGAEAMGWDTAKAIAAIKNAEGEKT